MNKCPLFKLFSAAFSAFLCFFLVISWVKMAPAIELRCCVVLVSVTRLSCVHGDILEHGDGVTVVVNPWPVTRC